MKACIIIENEVAWLVDEDDNRLLYFRNADEVADLGYSCSFAVQEMEANSIGPQSEHGADDWKRAFELEGEQ